MIPKFRAYSEQYGMRKVVGLYWFDDHVQITLENGSVTPIQVKESQVNIMQSTGIKNYFGKLIYEGDILTDEGDDQKDDWIYGVVYYDKDKRDWFVDWRSEGYVNYLACETYRAITGNIYQNPEFLEVQNG